MYKCSHNEALRAAEEGRKFSMLWEYVGSNPSNKSGESDKFWAVEGNNFEVWIRYGKRGTTGRVCNRGICLEDALNRAKDKVKEGYSWAGATVESTVPPPTLPLISKSLPSPWNRIRMVHDEVAYDREGEIVVKLTADSANQICSSYTLA